MARDCSLKPLSGSPLAWRRAGWLNPAFSGNQAPSVSVALLQLAEDRLAQHRARRQWLRPIMRRAAVALILKVFEGELHVLMIRRAERPGDPWSGQMAFPGGRLEPRDAHGFACACRETEEEIGVRLGDDDACLGRLSELNARPGRLRRGLAITPFVFRVERPLDVVPNHEVAEVVWVPLEFLLDTDNRSSMRWERDGRSLEMPCYHFGGRRIWGLSLKMLDELMDLVEGRNPRRPDWRRF